MSSGRAKVTEVRAKRIETTPEALIIVTDSGPAYIPWESCSERLAHALQAERDRTQLSPSDYGIHGPLVDGDLVVGSLVRMRDNES